MVGGYTGIYGTKTSYVERFDGAWSTMPPMTQPRCFCSIAVIAEKLYVSGGDYGSVPDTVGRFDPTPETWELLRPTLHHRRRTTVAVLRDRMYFVGGMDDDDIVLDSVECYDPDTDSWEEWTPLFNARCGAKVARVNEALCIFGGTGQELDELTSVERFDPVTGWWEALLDMTFTKTRLVAAIHA